MQINQNQNLTFDNIWSKKYQKYHPQDDGAVK